VEKIILGGERADGYGENVRDYRDQGLVSKEKSYNEKQQIKYA
jgi:hypothetical protein